ncbi:hypothetical protein V8F33_006811 [Rhypophila sp. PSN 637]
MTEQQEQRPKHAVENGHNPVKSYGFVCMCQVPFQIGVPEWDDDDQKRRPPCDNGVKCICDKPAADNPDHPWVLSFAGMHKFFAQKDQCQLRDPPNFHAHTFGEHEGTNLVLDFEDAGAAGNWREQYAICEAIAFFTMTELSYPATAAIDDPVLASRTHALVGRMFLSMLEQLNGNGLLTSTSPIPNLGLIMAFYIVAAGLRRASFKILKGTDTELLGDATDDNQKWCPDRFDDHIFAYAKKRDIKLARIGYAGIVLSSFEKKPLAVVPNPPTTAGSTDPWGFAEELESYKRSYAGLGAKLVKRHHRPAGTWVVSAVIISISRRGRAMSARSRPI